MRDEQLIFNKETSKRKVRLRSKADMEKNISNTCVQISTKSRIEKHEKLEEGGEVVVINSTFLFSQSFRRQGQGKNEISPAPVYRRILKTSFPCVLTSSFSSKKET